MNWFLLQLLFGVFMFWVPYRCGYRSGYDACDFSHDFDRCPHCKEIL